MEKKRTIEKRIRIYDEDDWRLIDKLLASDEFDDFNSVIIKALHIGLPRLCEMTFDFKSYYKNTRKEDQDDKTAERVFDTMITCDEIYVTLNIVKYLVSTLYNIEASKTESLDVTKDMLESGILSGLPEHLELIEKEMLSSSKRERVNKKE